MEKSDKIFFPHLDPLRFIAAFMIVFAHGFEGWNGWIGKNKIFLADNGVDFNKAGVYVDRFMSNLNFGVDIFFMLSGFLITYILIKEKDKLGYISLKKFYIRRILRIWPLYFFLIALAPFIVKWIQSTPEPDYLSTILFYNNFHAIKTEAWVFPFAHFWSICIEEHFYILWPIIITLTPKKHFLSLFSIIIFISILFKLYIILFFESQWYSIYLNTFCRIDVMVIGALFAYFHYIKPFKLSVPLIPQILLVLVLVGMLLFDGYNDYTNIFFAVLKKYSYVLLFGLLFLIYNFNDKVFIRFKPNSFIHYLGKTSYGIYMYGNIILIVFIKKVMYGFQIHNVYFFWISLITLSIVVPIISYELLEKPFLKLKDKFTNIVTKH